MQLGHRDLTPWDGCISRIPGMAGSSVPRLRACGAGISARQVTRYNHLDLTTSVWACWKAEAQTHGPSLVRAAPGHHLAEGQSIALWKKDGEAQKHCLSLILLMSSATTFTVWRLDHSQCHRENPSGLSLPGKKVIPEPKSSHGLTQGKQARQKVLQPDRGLFWYPFQHFQYGNTESLSTGNTF